MKPYTLKLLTLSLFTALLINPIVLLVASNNLQLSLITFLGSLLLAVALYNTSELRLLTSYVMSVYCTASILIHAEAIFVTNYKEYIVEDLYLPYDKYYFNRPLLRQAFNDKEYSADYVTSKQGFRIGFEDNSETEIIECDWLFLGDSCTQGAQVNFEELYTTELYKSFPDKIIVNSGISGWGIPEEYNYYLDQGHKLKAKKVFLQVCNFNDFMNVVEKETSFSDFVMSKSEFLRFLLYPFKYSNPAELPLGRWTEPFYPTKESNEDFNVFFKIKSQQQKKDLKNFASFLIKLNNEIRKNGAELIVLQIPSKEQLYYKYFEEVIKGFNLDVVDLDMNFPNEFLSSICKENSIKYLDLLVPLGQNEGEVFFHFDEHLNKGGHLSVAQALRNFLLEDKRNSTKSIDFLSQHNTEDRYPIFHDLNLVSYQSVRDSNIELFLSDSLLTNSRRLTFNNVDELHPCLDKDAGKVVFTEGDQSTGKTKVVSMLVDGTNRQYITQEGFYGAIPSFNRLHTKIAYPEWYADSEGMMTNPYIVTLELETGTKTQISDDAFESWRPIFSRDDTCLFYISKRESGYFDIYKYNTLDQSETNLTNSRYDEWDPYISPDGKKLVYAGFKDNNWDIFQLDLEDGKVKQLTTTVGNEWDPSYSFDGKFIYYAGVYGFMNGIYRFRASF